MAQESTKVHESVALEFTRLLMAGNFAGAHEMLSTSLKSKLTPEGLEEDFTRMFSFAESQPEAFELVASMERFAGQTPQDVGWAYIGISGRGWVEGATVIVTMEQGRAKIRSIVWGRP